MKKIFTILLSIIITPTYATTMCAANDTVAVVLDPSLSVSGNSYNDTIGTWWAWNDQSTVYGIGACLNSNHGKSIGGTVPYLRDVNNDGQDKLVVGGEKYGQYCWCKLVHPVSSLWTFYDNRGSVAACTSHCMDGCSGGFKLYYELRRGLFGSVSQQ